MRRTERAAVFQSRFLEDLAYWVKTDRKTALRVLELVQAVCKIRLAELVNPNCSSLALQVSGHGGSRRNIAWFTRFRIRRSDSTRPVIIY